VRKSSPRRVRATALPWICVVSVIVALAYAWSPSASSASSKLLLAEARAFKKMLGVPPSGGLLIPVKSPPEGGTPNPAYRHFLEVYSKHTTLSRLVTISTPAPVSCISAPSGLVSWWPGDGNANDIVGSNNGTLQNGTAFTTGKVGQAFNLDGINDYVDLGSGFNLDKLTLDAWAFITPGTNTGERRVLSKDNTSSGTRKAFALKSSAPFISGQQGHAAFVVLIGAAFDAIEAPTPLTAGWHHLAGVRDTMANRFELYVDGTMVASKSSGLVVGAIDSTVNTVIGTVSPSSVTENFAGLIDEVEIFNRALSGDEINLIFLADSFGKCKNPADLSINKTAPAGPVTSGSNITYMFTVTNTGLNTASSVVVTDNLPAGTAFVSCGSTGGGVCGGVGNHRTVSFASLGPGASAMITLVVKVTCSAPSGTLSNTATVSSSTPDPNLVNNSSTAMTTITNPSMISPTSVSVSASPTSNVVFVTVPSGCPWTATSNSSFLIVTQVLYFNGTDGNGMVNYSVVGNLGVARIGTITIAGQTFTVTQAGLVPPITYSVGGRVTNPEKTTGMPGVLMTFSRVKGAGFLPAPVTTDANGNWSQTGFQSDTTYRVRPSKSGFSFRLAYQDFNFASNFLNFIATPLSAGCLLTSITLGQTRFGVLSGNDCQSPLRGPGFFADRYGFTGTAGQPVIISLTAYDFSSIFYLLNPSGVVIAQSTGAPIALNLPVSGAYVIEVSSQVPVAVGNYELSLNPGP